MNADYLLPYIKRTDGPRRGPAPFLTGSRNSVRYSISFSYRF